MPLAEEVKIGKDMSTASYMKWEMIAGSKPNCKYNKPKMIDGMISSTSRA
jgi:hypothetical protein